jgi:hypothetical protein
MKYSLRRISDAASEPVTLAEVKLHAHIDHDVQDSILEGWIASGRMLAEDFQRRAYVAQVWEMVFDGFPSTPIAIPRAPLMGLMTIKATDYTNAITTIYDIGSNPADPEEAETTPSDNNADFIIDASSEPARIVHAYGKGWPSIQLRQISAVTLRFAAGYGLDADDVPATVKDAIMLYCTYRNENRAGESAEAPEQFYNLLRPGRLF